MKTTYPLAFFPVYSSSSMFSLLMISCLLFRGRSSMSSLLLVLISSLFLCVCSSMFSLPLVLPFLSNVVWLFFDVSSSCDLFLVYCSVAVLRYVFVLSFSYNLLRLFFDASSPCDSFPVYS